MQTIFWNRFLWSSLPLTECIIKVQRKRMSWGGKAEWLQFTGKCPGVPCLISVSLFTTQGNCQMLFSLKYFFHEQCSQPLQSTMLSVCRMSKFQKLSFGFRQLCAKIVLRPQACKAGALSFFSPSGAQLSWLLSQNIWGTSQDTLKDLEGRLSKRAGLAW